MLNTLIAFSLLFAAFWFALRWADSKLKNDRKRVSDKVTKMQLEINAEHNMHLMGTRTINHKIMIQHDEIMQQALTDRQL